MTAAGVDSAVRELVRHAQGPPGGEARSRIDEHVADQVDVDRVGREAVKQVEIIGEPLDVGRRGQPFAKCSRPFRGAGAAAGAPERRGWPIGTRIAAVKVIGPSLSLRYATLRDAPALFKLAADGEVTRFFSWGPYSSEREPVAYIEKLGTSRARGEKLEFLIVGADGAPIGVTGLSEFSRRDRRAVVGTWLGRRYWGTGANGEAKAMIARLAFAALGLERVGAYASVENVRSQAALTRHGFSREGVLRRWHRHGDATHDVVLYSLLRADWLGSPLAQVAVEIVGEPPESFSFVAAPS
jgi:[ribosomal protein S5]-alanine N-acetyltransferase